MTVRVKNNGPPPPGRISGNRINSKPCNSQSLGNLIAFAHRKSNTRRATGRELGRSRVKLECPDPVRCRVMVWDRGRDRRYRRPPAQIRT